MGTHKDPNHLGKPGLSAQCPDGLNQGGRRYFCWRERCGGGPRSSVWRRPDRGPCAHFGIPFDKLYHAPSSCSQLIWLRYAERGQFRVSLRFGPCYTSTVMRLVPVQCSRNDIDMPFVLENEFLNLSIQLTSAQNSFERSLFYNTRAETDRARYYLTDSTWQTYLTHRVELM